MKLLENNLLVYEILANISYFKINNVSKIDNK